MPKQTEEQPKIDIPQAPTTRDKSNRAYRPEEIDPELANLAMAKLLVEKMGTPSKITPIFNIRNAMLTALQDCPENRTGIDCTMRKRLYEAYERGTVNEMGVYFDRIWAYLMKPKYIMTGYAGMPEQKEEKDPWYSFILGSSKKKQEGQQK